MNLNEFPNMPFCPWVYWQKDAPYMTAPFSVRHCAKPSKGPGLLDCIKLYPKPAAIKTIMIEEAEIKIVFLLIGFLPADSSALGSALWLSCLKLAASSLLNAILRSLLRQLQLVQKHLHCLYQALPLRSHRLYSPDMAGPAGHMPHILSGHYSLGLLCSLKPIKLPTLK